MALGVNTGKLVETGKLVLKETMSDDIGGASAEVAYRTLLALFPFFIFMAALGGFVATPLGIENPTDQVMNDIGSSLPSDARSVLRGQLEDVLESKNAGLMSLGAILAVWSASSAIGAVMKALNRAYDVEETRPFLKKTALQVGLTVLASVAFVSTFTILIVGQLFAEEVSDALGLGISGGVLSLFRFPVVFLLLTAGMAYLYWAAPNVDIAFRWVTPGAFIFIIAWILFSVAFGIYVANFGAYQSTYGTLGGVVVLLVFLYLSAYIMLIGAEINAVVEAQVEPESMEAPAGASEAGPVAARREGANGGRHEIESQALPRMLLLAGTLVGIILALRSRASRA